MLVASRRSCGNDEGTGRRRPREPLAELDGRVWRAGGAATAAQAGGARTQAGTNLAPGRRRHRVAAAAQARERARKKRLCGGSSKGTTPARPAEAHHPAGDDPAGRREAHPVLSRARFHRVRSVRPVPVRTVRTAATTTLAVVVRLLPVQRGNGGRLCVMHVLRQGALLPLRARGRRRGGGGAMRLWRWWACSGDEMGLHGCAVVGATLSVALLAPASVCSGRRQDLCTRCPQWMPVPGERAAGYVASHAAEYALQYYLVPPHCTVHSRLVLSASRDRTAPRPLPSDGRSISVIKRCMYTCINIYFGAHEDTSDACAPDRMFARAGLAVMTFRESEMRAKRIQCNIILILVRNAECEECGSACWEDACGEAEWRAGDMHDVNAYVVLYVTRSSESDANV